MVDGVGTQPVVVVGNGGHSRSCIDAWDPDAPFRPLGCTGNDPAEHGELPYLGDDSIIPGLLEQGVRHAFVAIGSNSLRARLSADLVSSGFDLVPLVAPTARVAPTAEIGPGAAILHGAIVGAYARVGAGAIVNTGASVDHDCVVGEFAHIAPGSHLAGSVTVGERAMLGVGVSVIPGVTIGEGAVVGAGSVVISDVRAGETVVGVPTRSVRKIAS